MIDGWRLGVVQHSCYQLPKLITQYLALQLDNTTRPLTGTFRNSAWLNASEPLAAAGECPTLVYLFPL